MRTPKEALEAAIAACEGQSATALAARIGGRVVRQNVEYWLKVGRVPAEHCPAIERAVMGAVKCEELCPGVAWEVLREQAA